jgi:hypothetical protein
MSDRNVNLRINIDKGRNTASADIRRAERDIENLRRETLKAADAAEKLEREMKGIGGSSLFGRTGGGLERVISGLGGNNALLGLVGDIGDVVEGLAGDPGGLKGALRNVLTPAGLLAGGLAVVSVGMAALDAILREAAKGANEAAQAYIVNRDLQRTIRDESLTTAQIQEKLVDAQKREADALAALAGQSEIMNDTFEESSRKFTDLGARIGLFAANLGGSFDTYNADVAAQQAALAKARAEIATYTTALQGQTVAANDAFAAVKSLVGDGIGLLSEGSQLAEEAVGELGKSLTEGAKAFDELSEAAAKAFTDLQTSVQSAVDKLDADGTKLSDALRNTVAKLNADLIAAQQNANDDINDARAEAAAESLAAEKEFQSELNRAETSFRREQSRIKRAALMEERDAIEANDIIALLDARESKKEQLRENRIAFRDEQKQRREDFEARKQTEAAALALTIASIERQRDAEIAGINARIIEEQKAFDAAIAEVNRLKEAQIAQVEAAIAAEQRKHEAVMANIEAERQGYEALVLYRNGQLYQLNPALKNSPAAPGLLPVPPAPDPFGLGQFFNSPPPTEGANAVPEGRQSVTPVYNFDGAQFNLGELMTIEDGKNLGRAIAAGIHEARTGVAA